MSAIQRTSRLLCRAPDRKPHLEPARREICCYSNAASRDFQQQQALDPVFGPQYDGQHNELNQRNVSSYYFATVQAKLLSGRYFIDADNASKPGGVIFNQALAR